MHISVLLLRQKRATLQTPLVAANMVLLLISNLLQVTVSTLGDSGHAIWSSFFFSKDWQVGGLQKACMIHHALTGVTGLQR